MGLKNLDLDLFREKLLDKLGADWGRPTPELLQAQTTAEEAKAKHQARQARPECSSPSRLPSARGLARSESPLRRGSLSRPRHGGTSVWTTSHPSRTPTLRPRRSSRWVESLSGGPPGGSDRDPHAKGGGSGVARPGAEGPDRQPTIPPASGSGATSSGAEGPDKPSATPVGLDTQDLEVQLAVLRWMMSKRVGEVRIFAGRWSDDRAQYTSTKVNPKALEKGTHPRNHQVGGLPWARYSVDELYQQAKAGDRPYPEDLRSFGGPPRSG